MSNETPRIAPNNLVNGPAVFRLIGQIDQQVNESAIIIKSYITPTEEIKIKNVKVNTSDIEVGKWYEFVCRNSDSGDDGILVLDCIQCPLPDGEEMSIEGVVALQNICGKFPEIY